MACTLASSEHLGASFTWFQDSHGADKTGPLAGVPYDGANPHTKISTISPPSRATRAGTATTPAGSSSGTTKSRNSWITTTPTCSTATAACRSATKSA